ncbi:type II secretion system protein GspL [Polynucleobacter arcticus]|uniref:type II secretion system protein GspL n=1 Tax=Polynucleobacter arcticus TaxID=1743165 RepID=UPI00156E0E50|nr:type II secretion system protein GspL [Polynucleobacter arcticus]
MSLLIVCCPLKPFIGAGSGASSAQSDSAREWQDLACAEQFAWCLIDEPTSKVSDPAQSNSENGVGTTESMPYADEVLVLLPTIDVRLIEVKVPLANAKKLQQILPNLIEEYVLTGAQNLSVQALPPVPGKPAMQRVIALIDRAWYTWLSKQLEGLLSQRVRLIPDCFLLNLPVHGEQRVIAYQQHGDNMIFTARSSDQLGLAWIENNVDHATPDQITLPQSVKDAHLTELSWPLLVEGAQRFMQETTSSHSANYALNLLPKTFRREAGSGSAFTQFSDMLKRKRAGKDLAVGANTSWTNPALWHQPSRWATYLLATVLLGYALHLSFLVLDNWRWGNQMEVLAVQSLTPASIAKLNQDKAIDGKQATGAVIDTLTKQVAQDQRRQGLVSDADFAPMAAKLQLLRAGYGPDVLQKINYDGYGIDFEFKSGSMNQTSAQVIQKARSLGFMVKVIGPHRYRLEPFAGLGS